MKDIQRLPTRADIDVHGSLDERSACEHFLGKSLDEAKALFRENSLHYQEDPMWMGPVAFRFYIRAAISYVESEYAAGDSDIISCLAAISSFRQKFDPAPASWRIFAQKSWSGSTATTLTRRFTRVCARNNSIWPIFSPALLMARMHPAGRIESKPSVMMKPMQPMSPMKPMEPMAPMKAPERWWPEDLGEHPNSAGGQNETRYAFFGDKRRLAVDTGDGKVRVYDTGDERISGVQQHQTGSGRKTTFTSQRGELDLDALTPV